MSDAAIQSPPSPQSPSSYMDFAGLGRLRGQARANGADAAKQTGQQFEAMFIQMMLKSMRDATPKDEENQSSAMDTYQSMFDQEVASAMAKRHTLGLADMITQQLTKSTVSPAEAQKRLVLQGTDGSANPGMPLHPPVPSLPLRSGATHEFQLPQKLQDGLPVDVRPVVNSNASGNTLEP